MFDKHKIYRFLLCAELLILPVVLMVIFDPAARLSRWNLCSEIVDTLLFLDLPIAVCMFHWFHPQWFRWKKCGCYSPLPWMLFTWIGWMGVAGEMYVSGLLGRGPENGFAAFCAYFFGWAYVWITMIPIGLLYLLLRYVVSVLAVKNTPQEAKHTGEPEK